MAEVDPFARNSMIETAENVAREGGISTAGQIHKGNIMARARMNVLSDPSAAFEELLLSGGGIGLFTGCAAGDTAGAIVLNVREV